MANQQMMADEIILIADERILAVPVMENKESLINLCDQKEIFYGPSPEIPNNTDYTKLRKTVYEKLLQAQALLPKGILFCIYEAYRSLALQKKLYDERYRKIKQQYPQWSERQVFNETTKLISPIINFDGSENVPPHATGGAIDVYLINDQGQALDMGIHPADWMTDKEGVLSLTLSPLISAEAVSNRTLMGNVLSKVGFVNYPTEYWHWSYGDRYWAYFKAKTHACYGLA